MPVQSMPYGLKKLDQMQGLQVRQVPVPMGNGNLLNRYKMPSNGLHSALGVNHIEFEVIKLLLNRKSRTPQQP